MEDDDPHDRSNNVPCDKTIPHDAAVKTSVYWSPSDNQIVTKQTSYDYCQAATIFIGHPSSKFCTNNRDVLVRKLPLGKVKQIAVPTSLRERVFYLARCVPIAGHPEQRQL